MSYSGSQAVCRFGSEITARAMGHPLSIDAAQSAPLRLPSGGCALIERLAMKSTLPMPGQAVGGLAQKIGPLGNI